MTWEIRRLDQDENILKEINIIARPVGILLFGADGELKNEVRDKILDKISHIGEVYEFGESKDLSQLQKSLKARDNVLVIMDNHTSRRHMHREAAAKELRIFGARIVVGVCVRYTSGSLRDGDRIETDIQLQFHPSTIYDGLDYLIVVGEP